MACLFSSPKSAILGEVQKSPPFLFCKMGEAGEGTSLVVNKRWPISRPQISLVCESS